MKILVFLAEWALRSSVLILCGAGLLWMLRVKDAFVRLTAWTALLASSLAIPALTLLLPRLPIVVMQADSPLVPQAMPGASGRLMVVPESLPEPVHAARWHFDWAQIAVAIYGAVVLLLLLRLLVGVVLSRRLLRASAATGRAFRESDRVSAPVTLGIVRPVIVLPRDWREWEEAKLGAVLAHERSHVRRYDPAIQMVSAIHRALLWIGPLSWFLHSRIVCAAEDASDDAAIAATRDRAFYAEVLLGFMERGVRGVNWLGIPMARYGQVDRRIHRILDGTALSTKITRWAVTAILAVTAPLAYLVATAHPSQAAPQVPASSSPPTPVSPSPAKTPVPAVRKPQAAPAYLKGLGTVTAITVNVTARIDGLLTSADLVEGGPVEVGQLLASIESPQIRTQLDNATNQLSEDRRKGLSGLAIQMDETAVALAQRQLAYGQVRAPIAGLAGFRKVDPGNFVHAGDTLLVITQLHPISVVFQLAEDAIPQVQALLRSGASPVVEAWTRDMTARLATGRLTAMDNEIDDSQGIIKLKASFDNKNGALFPNQFVNVHLLLSTR
jgi:multidrug efflux pump subunit AcrA (membrane-fusion protein)